MANALREAESLGLDCVQVFTKNQQQWNAKPLERAAIEEWTGEMKRLRWGPRHITSHASYLANLASPNPELQEASVGLMRTEMDRAEQLGIGLLVFHPGAYTTSSLDEGTARIANACVRLIKETAGYSVVLCLENVAGQGSTIGRTFEELADLRGRIVDVVGATEGGRVGFCIDTAHAHAAGYDLSTRAGAEKVLAEMTEKLGTENIRCMHINDSKTPMGSRVDRHAHIGEGTIGLAGFAAVVNHPAFADIPKIMETPKEDAKSKPQPGAMAWDRINVGRLRSLIGSKERTFVLPTPIGAAGTAAKPKAVGSKGSKPASTPPHAKKPASRKRKA